MLIFVGMFYLIFINVIYLKLNVIPEDLNGETTSFDTFSNHLTPFLSFSFLKKFQLKLGIFSRIKLLSAQNGEAYLESCEACEAELLSVRDRIVL